MPYPVVISIEHWPRTASGRDLLIKCIRDSFEAGRPYLFPDDSPIGEAIFDLDDWIGGNAARVAGA